jgi:hypothetical protein
LTEKGIESDEKKGEKRTRRARKVTERNMISMHLLEECEAIFKRDGKKGGKRARRAKKWRKER